MGMYLSGKFYAKKINSLKILKNAKTASKFYFPCSERVIFYHIKLWLTFSQLP